MTSSDGVSKPGNRLTDFPRPSLAVDVAVLSIVPDPEGIDRLSVLLIRRDTDTHRGRWSLPGSLVRERERLADAVERTLDNKANVTGLAPRQLVVLDDPSRDDRGWVISVAFLDTIRAGDAADIVDGASTVWASVDDLGGRSPVRIPGRQRRLPFDHDTIVSIAVDHMRDAYGKRPDPFGLLQEPFTILELRKAHEAVAGVGLQKDTFRRAMLPYLQATKSVDEGTVGRPARRYRCAEG